MRKAYVRNVTINLEERKLLKRVRTPIDPAMPIKCVWSVIITGSISVIRPIKESIPEMATLLIEFYWSFILN